LYMTGQTQNILTIDRSSDNLVTRRSKRFWECRLEEEERNPPLHRQCYLVLPGLFCCECHPSVELTRWPTNAWQKSWREQSTQRPSRPQNQNQPNEERMRNTHSRKRQRLVVMHGTTATIRPRHASRNFAAITKFLTRKCDHLPINQLLAANIEFTLREFKVQ